MNAANTWQYLGNFIGAKLIKNFDQVSVFDDLGHLQLYFKFVLCSFSLMIMSENDVHASEFT